MTDLDPELQRLLEPMREDVVVGELSPEARARVIASMPSLYRLRARARLLRRLYIGVPVVLAAAALLLMVRPEPAVHVAASGSLSWTDARLGVRMLQGESDLVGDGELSVPAGAEAQLTTPAGVWVEASASTRLRLRRAKGGEHAVMLERGRVHCRVPPLGRERQFVVATPTAQVIVHGTDFSVELREAQQPPCVRVREGLVEVRYGSTKPAWLGPGTELGCAQPAVVPEVAAVATQQSAPEARELAPAPIEARASAREERRHHRGRHAKRMRTSLPRSPASSTLEVENRLLADALRAEQLGEDARASTLFKQLLETYPESQLAPEARAGLARTKPRSARAE
jgi:FecR protein